MNIGIICEYNPFHNGHIYHIKKIKELYPDSTIILVMSGNFTQRGELSVLNKWDKTKIALNHNIDLVIELPFKYATQSADLFAAGSINILKQMSVDTLIFGSESNDIELLTSLAQIQLNNSKFDGLVKEYLDNGLNYPTALNKALNKLTNVNIYEPNDLLAISYIKEIIKQKANIKPISIQRTNDYHSTNLDIISSASSIRLALKNNQDVSKSIPKDCLSYISKPFFLDNYFDLIKYKIITDDLSNIQGIDEGIDNRLKKYIYNSYSLEELIQNVKTKRYTYNRIKRLLVHILVNYTKEDDNKDYNYIRVLGFNNKGKNYLKIIKKDIKIPLITNYSNSNGLLNLDYKINSILYTKYPKDKQQELLKEEKQQLIIN